MVKVQFQTLSLRFPEVLEVPEAARGCGNKQNVIGIPGAEPASAPTQPRFRAAAHARLECPSDHLLKWRIAGHRVRKLAWQVRIRAAEFDAGGRAIPFAAAEIGVDRSHRAKGDAYGRIEPIEGVFRGQGLGARGPDSITI